MELRNGDNNNSPLLTTVSIQSTKVFYTRRNVLRTSIVRSTVLVPQLSIWSKLAYGSGHVLNDICGALWLAYSLLYMKQVLNLSAEDAGLLILIGQIADAVANPVVGYLSDKYDQFWLCRYGKRKIWHLLGSIILACTFPFCFTSCLICDNRPEWVKMAYYSVFIILSQFGWAAVQISHLSLMPQLSPLDEERTSLAAVRYCFTVASNVTAYLITLIALGGRHEKCDIFSNCKSGSKLRPEDAPKFQSIVWASLGIGIVCLLIFHIFVKEKATYARSANGVIPQRRGIKEMLANIDYYQAALVYMSTMLFVNLNQIFIPSYLNYDTKASAISLAVVPLASYVGSLVTSFVVDRLNAVCGRKLTYIIGTAVGITACIWLRLRSDYATFVTVEIYIVAVLFGVASSIVLVTNLGVTADVIGSKTESGALVYGVVCFTDKLGNGIAVYVIEQLQQDLKEYYRDVVCYVCCAAVVLGALVTLTLRSPRRQGYTMM